MSASGARSMLPPLTPEERRHSDAVGALLHTGLARAGGWLSFERFMELALYAPGLGYYSAGSVKLGADGDFVTAPEVSDLFGRCVARQCAAVLATVGGEILEIGAGTGRMAAALLTELDSQGVLPSRYAILEVSADLAQRQRVRLARLPPRLSERIVWLSALPTNPVRGVIVANEVADALPCRRFLLRDGAVCELGVRLGADGALVAAEAPADAVLAAACGEILASLPGPLPEGYVSEVCPRLDAWIGTLAECLGAGLMLIGDYGLPRRHYYHPQRTSGTLRCHFRHRAHDDPFVNLGLQDLTAWVDFTRLAHAADAAGLEVGGFTTQAAFLLGLGLEQLVAAGGEGVAHARLAGEARRLIMPEEMGETFKFMALTRACQVPLAGFALQDLRHLL